jgi:hypothetical protein
VVVVPPVVRKACRQGARRVAFAVLCPSAWPVAEHAGTPPLRWITLRPSVYLLNAFNGDQWLPAHVFHLLIGGQAHTFGAHWTAIDPGLRITTKLVRIPVEGGGTFVQQRPARRIGMSAVHGSPALLLREPPYPQGGLHGGHVLALWNQDGHGYVVSVHGIGLDQQALIAVAVTVARSTAALSGG